MTNFEAMLTKELIEDKALGLRIKEEGEMLTKLYKNRTSKPKRPSRTEFKKELISIAEFMCGMLS